MELKDYVESATDLLIKEGISDELSVEVEYMVLPYTNCFPTRQVFLSEEAKAEDPKFFPLLYQSLSDEFKKAVEEYFFDCDGHDPLDFDDEDKKNYAHLLDKRQMECGFIRCAASDNARYRARRLFLPSVIYLEHGYAQAIGVDVCSENERDILSLDLIARTTWARTKPEIEAGWYELAKKWGFEPENPTRIIKSNLAGE